MARSPVAWSPHSQPSPGLVASSRAFPGGTPKSNFLSASLNIRRSWARLIRQVYEVDPLVCVRCGGTMKIIAVIERPAVIRQILDHVGLPTGAASLRAPPDPPGGQAAAQPREWSYEPFLDDLPIGDLSA